MKKILITLALCAVMGSSQAAAAESTSKAYATSFAKVQEELASPKKTNLLLSITGGAAGFMLAGEGINYGYYGYADETSNRGFVIKSILMLLLTLAGNAARRRWLVKKIETLTDKTVRADLAGDSDAYKRTLKSLSWWTAIHRLAKGFLTGSGAISAFGVGGGSYQWAKGHNMKGYQTRERRPA